MALSCGPKRRRHYPNQENYTELGSILFQHLLSGADNHTDATFVFGNIKFPVHRCVLAAMSSFFKDLFQRKKVPEYDLREELPYGHIGYEAFVHVVAFLYTKERNAPPTEVATCVDEGCDHRACRPRIDFTVQLYYASRIFQQPELASTLETELLGIVDEATLEDVLSIVKAAHRCASTKLLDPCIERISKSKLDCKFLMNEEFKIANEVKGLRKRSLEEDEPTSAARKRIKIHQALDSDDLELMKMLLSESKMTLDEAYALHHAVAHCNDKIVRDLLALDGLDVNLKNSRGYTALHIAARRRDPFVMLVLLDHGANPWESTPDGRNAETICCRLTTRKDMNIQLVKKGDSAPDDDRVPRGNMHCLNFLRRKMNTDPTSSAPLFSAPISDDELYDLLCGLENRVAIARRFFPFEVEIAMKMAEADTTSEFTGYGNEKEASARLALIKLDDGHRTRLTALTRTVEIARMYFPECFDYVNNYMEEDLLI